MTQHITTQGQAKERNRKGGLNHAFLASMCLVTLYQFWEDHFRGRIADALGVDPATALKVPVFGDLRLIRNSIIHNAGVATSDTAKCEVLRWFKRGDWIELTDQQMESIINLLYKYVDSLPSSVKVVHPAASRYLAAGEPGGARTRSSRGEARLIPVADWAFTERRRRQPSPDCAGI